MRKPIERPILFSDAMVRAILEGRKTQTRRVMKPQPPAGAKNPGLVLHPADGGSACVFDVPINSPVYRHLCPYGQPGNRLWVRGAWNAQSIDGWWWNEPPFPMTCAEKMTYNWCATYRADPILDDEPTRWVPSIHMPREFARIILNITEIRVERVQDISEEDALAEGITWLRDEPGMNGNPDRAAWSVFAYLWDSINAKRGYGWYANPWVWVIEFERAL